LVSAVRFLAFQAIEKIMDAPGVGDWDEGVHLEGPDQALFHDIVQGTLRNWRFLEKCVKSHCTRPPKRNMTYVLYTSAYQIIFYDRVPEYAVFAEAKKVAQRIGFSPDEERFLSAVLKRIAENKSNYRDVHEKTLERLRLGGEFQDGDLDILNVSDDLLNLLKKGPKGSFKTVVQCLVQMKKIPAVVGIELPSVTGDKPFEDTVLKKDSAIAPLLSEYRGSSVDGSIFRVQSETSQFSCNLFAKEIKSAFQKGTKKIRILDVAAGKGGKLFGTLLHLYGDANNLGPLEWVATDRSERQLRMLRSEWENAKKNWAVAFDKLEIKSVVHDWKQPFSSDESFDFIWLDAPCTGFGTLAKHPEIALLRGSQPQVAVKELAELQKEMLKQSVEHLKKSGRYFYSVCTLSEAETVGQRDYLEKLLARKSVETRSEWVFWPGSEPAPLSEGFYLTVL